MKSLQTYNKPKTQKKTYHTSCVEANYAVHLSLSKAQDPVVGS